MARKSSKLPWIAAFLSFFVTFIATTAMPTYRPAQSLNHFVMAFASPLLVFMRFVPKDIQGLFMVIAILTGPVFWFFVFKRIIRKKEAKRSF